MDTLFGNGTAGKPKRETTKQRNERRKANARTKKARADMAILEANNAVKYEDHLNIMRDLEKMYGKRYTRAAGNTNYVLQEIALFNNRSR